MTDPMAPERRAEIAEHLARTRDLNVCVDDWHLTLAGDADNLLAEVERLRAELAEVREERAGIVKAAREVARQKDLYFEQRATARALAKKAERERDEAREQVRVLAMGADPLCPDHGDHVTTGCESCAHASAVRTARSSLDGTGAP